MNSETMRIFDPYKIVLNLTDKTDLRGGVPGWGGQTPPKTVLSQFEKGGRLVVELKIPPRKKHTYYKSTKAIRRNLIQHGRAEMPLYNESMRVTGQSWKEGSTLAT